MISFVGWSTDVRCSFDRGSESWVLRSASLVGKSRTHLRKADFRYYSLLSQLLKFFFSLPLLRFVSLIIPQLPILGAYGDPVPPALQAPPNDLPSARSPCYTVLTARK